MLVEVPINVQTPPNWLAKERGISTRDGAIFRAFERMTAMGINMATVAVLMIKADSTAIVRHRTMISFRSPLPANLSRYLASHSTRPVRTNPALRMNMAATVAVAVFANPYSACSGLISCKTRSATSTHIAVRSTRNFSVTNRRAAAAVIASIRILSRGGMVL